MNIHDASATLWSSHENNSSYVNNVKTVRHGIWDDAHTILSQDIQSIVDSKDSAKIADFIEHADKITQYKIMELLSPDLVAELLPQISDNKLSYILNNFHGKLPRGYQSVFYHNLVQTNDAGSLDSIKQHNDIAKWYSEKYSGTTFAGFYQDIQTAAKDTNLDVVFWPQSEIPNPRMAMAINNKLLIPIYITLRKMGYNHKELTE